MNGNGSTFLVYTTEEGGYLKIYTPFSEEEFDDLRNSGYLDVTPSDIDTKEREIAKPVFAALAKIIDNHDFISNGPREPA